MWVSTIIVIMNLNVANLGCIREEELFNALVMRFGKNCVYHSPKIRVHGQEKELGDIVVLALPYMIVFQLKWKKITSKDLCGENKKLYRDRLIATLRKAAQQFKELASSLRQKAIIELPQVWFSNSTSTYQFPLELVEYVIPVVIVDFDDSQYDNPEERYEDIPPVVTEVPAQIKSWGTVHSFLLRNFYHILDQLFTVGDFLRWLQERERMIGVKSRAIIGYSELTLFAIYLLNYPLWEKMLKVDCVFLMDNDCLERSMRDMKKEFSKRQELFGKRDIFDVIDDTLVESLAQVDATHLNDSILSYLVCQGRILCCSAMSRREISIRMKNHIVQFVPNGNAFRGSFALPPEQIPLSKTAFYFGVIPYTNISAAEYCGCAYGRTLAVLRDKGFDRLVDEVLVLLIRHKVGDVFCMWKRIEIKDYGLAFNDIIIDNAKFSLAKQISNKSEWDVVREFLK